MDISTRNTNCTLKIGAGRIRDLTIFLGKNLKNTFNEGMFDNDIDTLAAMLWKFGDFKSIGKAEEFIDEWLKENKDKTLQDLYFAIAEAVNEEGFFKKRLKQDELMPYLMEIEIDNKILVQRAMEKATSDVVMNQTVSKLKSKS